MDYHSWGRYSAPRGQEARKIYWCFDQLPIRDTDQFVLPYGLGRSYGDSCLNGGGVLIDTSGLDHFIAFDSQRGLLRCEAGVTLAEILRLLAPGGLVPRSFSEGGWFLPVVPGTRFVTMGGAIANDIHGKNHHRVGTFGHHITQFELVRSTGERVVCSSRRHADLFRATIGGLGLTGLITWAEIRLKPLAGPLLVVETFKTR